MLMSPFMRTLKNEHGSVLVFITFMMVILLIMVGIGLDTGHLAYTRVNGQSAVDAAALAAVSGLPSGDINQVQARAVAYNSTNNFAGSNTVGIQGSNVTLINYDYATNTITKAADIASANGVRVALEGSNPYDGSATNTPIPTPMFLTPLLRLFGYASTSATQNVSVSAVATITALPGIPIAIAGCAPANAGCTGGSGTEADPYTGCKLLQTSSANNGGGSGGGSTNKGNGNGGNSDNGTYQDSGWTTFTIPSANAPAIKDLVGNNSTCNAIPPVSADGACIYLNNGQITPVLKEFDTVYGANGDGFSGVNSAPNTNDWGILPVVRKDIANFNGCEVVQSWAKFGIRSVVISGNDKYLVGDLICNVDIHKVGATGCYTHKLMRDKPSGY